MKRAAVLALLLSACSPGNAPPSRNEAASAPAPAPVPSAAFAPAGSSLRGQVSALHGDTSGLQTRVTKLGTVIELPTDTLFAFDRADLSRDAAANLAKAAELIRQAPPGPIVSTGHTDAQGRRGLQPAPVRTPRRRGDRLDAHAGRSPPAGVHGCGQG